MNYLTIPLRLRLEAFKRNGKTHLGHGWHEPEYDKSLSHKSNKERGVRWFWVPDRTVATGLVNGESHHGCWGGDPWKIKGSSTELRFVESVSRYFRNVRPAHEVLKLGHTGWYVDQHQDDTTHGLVLQLPGRDGKPLFLHGCSDPWNSDAAIVAWRKCEWSEDKAEAARWADDLARHYGEFLVEDSIEQERLHRLEEEANEARSRLARIREEISTLVCDIRESTLSPGLCERMRREIKKLMRERSGCFEVIGKFEAEHSNP